MRLRKKKKQRKVSSQRGKRRTEKIEKTGSILKIVGAILMIVFYVIMLYLIITTQLLPSDPIEEIGNNTISQVSFNLLIKNQILII